MKIKTIILVVLIPVALYFCNSTPEGDQTGIPKLKTETILTGYEIIWGMDFLPNGDLIFTEKKGKIYRRSNGNVTEITGFPKVRAEGQGGLLDIKAHPQYSKNGWIYSCYCATGTGGKGQLILVRFKIAGDKVSNMEQLFSTTPTDGWNGHYGSRIEFDRQNHLFLSAGEDGDGTYGGPKRKNNNAQDLTSPWGKIHRLMDDGKIPSDNPVFPGSSKPTSIFSYGHRNPQGLVMHPEKDELWETEHGPKGGDEINIIKKGANYGWPIYSLGVNYDGTEISSGHKAEGITEPLYAFIPSIGTCGTIFITSSKFKSFQGSLLISGLASQKLHRMSVNGYKIKEEDPLLTDNRVRDVIQAPDGSIYVSVENPGRIIQITPQ